MTKFIRVILEKFSLRKRRILATTPKRLGVTKSKRNNEVVVSLTTYPGRIKSSYKTLCCLLNQDYKPDRVILWLAKEQFDDFPIPKEILQLQRYGLEIRWWHDIRSYKKLIPALHEFPDAIIVTVDDDWYYRKDMLRVLVEEHEKYPHEILCHDITHPYLDENNQIRTSKEKVEYRGTSSWLHKILSGSGVLFKRAMLDEEVLNEEVFMKEAPTNDDIWFWIMALKKGTKIRQPEKAHGCIMMTEPETQFDTSLANCNLNIYETVTNNLMKIYPETIDVLLKEKNNEC